jgi:hypothetical protein
MTRTLALPGDPSLLGSSLISGVVVGSGGGQTTHPQRQVLIQYPAQCGVHRLTHGGLHRGGDMKHYFDESFRQLNTAITMPMSTVIGPLMDQVVVLLIGLPPSTPNPWSAQIRPNTARINPTANVTTKALLIGGCYAPERAADMRTPAVGYGRGSVPALRIEKPEPEGVRDLSDRSLGAHAVAGLVQRR